MEVQPRPHFLEAGHTRRHFETAFFQSTIADNRSYEQWQAEGSTWQHQRANGVWKQMLQDYHQPYIKQNKIEAIDEFISRQFREFVNNQNTEKVTKWIFTQTGPHQAL